MADSDPSFPSVPGSRVVLKKHTRFSLVWIIPALAAVIGVWVALARILSQGPEITLVMRTAEGLEAGKTKIHYNGVDIGTVTAIRLSDDHQHVILTAQMAAKTEEFLVQDTKFWVVRPRISGANVTGLGTLISGAYIGMEIGSSQESKREFVTLETPPVINREVLGRYFVLKTPDLGSLDTGTPVYFRRLQVGEIASYKLDKDGRFFTVKVFVRAPYDQYVTSNTRFWQASGVDLSLTASGLNVQTQSLLSILIGGIAFEAPATGPVLPPADANTLFTLYTNREEAFQPAARNPQVFQLIFKESVRGLMPGAPVDFRGIQIGEVSEIHAQVDLKTFEFAVPVTINLDPRRLGVKLVNLKPGEDLAVVRRKLIDALVAHGARAQLQTGNLLTGAAFVAFDFFPNAPPATVDWSQNPVQLPTTPGQLEAIEAGVGSIIRKVDKMPLQQIGDELQSVLNSLNLTLASTRDTLGGANTLMGNANNLIGNANTLVGNTNNLVEPNSVQSQQLESTLQEVSRAAQAVRVLADYLERHPEALLRGKRGGSQ